MNKPTILSTKGDAKEAKKSDLGELRSKVTNQKPQPPVKKVPKVSKVPKVK